MKAILVFNEMPNSCEECIVRCDGYTAKEYAQRTIIKPNWCPLKSLPSKLVPFGYLDAGNEDGLYEKGYNDCLDDITGETE